MSVLIKGMEMPKCCEDCPLGEESDSLYYSCYPQGLDYTHDPKSGRMPNCPLIEVPSADVQPVGYTLEECGNYLLFLWMENILTDAEYNRAVERFHKKIHEKRMDGET